MMTAKSSCCHPRNEDHRCRAVGKAAMGHSVPVGDPAPSNAAQQQEAPRSWWRRIIAYLRCWSGDDAYERYLAEHQQHSHALLSRREFYKRYLDHRAGGSRCC